MRRLVPLLAAVLALAGCSTTHHAAPRRLTPGPAACAGGYQTAYGCQAHSPTFGLPPTGAPKLTAPSSTPSVAMADSVTVSALPRGLGAYAGYLNGSFANFSSIAVSFAAAKHVPVTVQAFIVYPSTARMVCLDVEPGDAVPSAAGAWARGEIGLGVKPCIYANLSTMPEVRASLDARGLARSSYFLWVADWTGRPGLISGFDAVQWLNHGPDGENYDQDSASRAFLGLTDPKPPTPDLGGAQHYERYDNTVRHLAGQRMRERNTILTWDHAHCERPARRSVCRSSAAHMRSLLGRDQAVYHRQTRAERAADRTPGRIQGLTHRLNDGRGVVRRWL